VQASTIRLCSRPRTFGAACSAPGNIPENRTAAENARAASSVGEISCRSTDNTLLFATGTESYCEGGTETSPNDPVLAIPGKVFGKVQASFHHTHEQSRGGSAFMPGKKHLRGVGSKEQRQYEHIKKSAEQSGRYGRRAKEVAARTVMKEHKEKGHRTGQ